MAAPANPFNVGRTVTGSSFVNRVAELSALTSYCASNANVLLIAPRRLGKTSLIHETFRRLDRKKFLLLFVNVQRCIDEHAVAQALLDELAATAFGAFRRGWLWAMEQFQTRRPAYTTDPQTGLPSLVLQKVGRGLQNLSDVLRLLEKTAVKKRRRIVVAIDEFQTLMERDDGPATIAAIRSIVQDQRHVTYIFCGSKKHVLLRLVNDRDNPFWGQLQTLEIGGIAVEHFAPLAKRAFSAAGRPIDDTTIAKVGETCGDNPKRIQAIFLQLLVSDARPTPARVDEALCRLIDEESHRFEDLLAQLKEGDQKRLLLALAIEGAPAAITGKDFVSKYDLGGSSNVQYASRRLRDEGILNDRNWFVDPFFYRFLRNDSANRKS